MFLAGTSHVCTLRLILIPVDIRTVHLSRRVCHTFTRRQCFDLCTDQNGYQSSGNACAGWSGRFRYHRSVAEYTHTTIVFIIIWIISLHGAFIWCDFVRNDRSPPTPVWACGSSELIGSPSKLHALLVDAADLVPVEGNRDGSYLTFRSKPAFICLSTVSSFLSQHIFS